MRSRTPAPNVWSRHMFRNTCKATVCLAIVVISSVTTAAAQPGPPGSIQPTSDDVYVRVVDVGPGLCTITEIPGPYYMLYDAGHWLGTGCLDAVRDVVDGQEIDLFVVSHSDGDHLGEAAEILHEYFVRHVIRTGDVRSSRSWTEMNDSIADWAKYGTSITNLQTVDLERGKRIQLGDATVTLVAGWGDWTDSGPTAAERRNAISIVVRLEYHGQSVLYTGDTIGRRLDDPDDACKDAEADMVQNADSIPLESDLIIAPHHGGNNGSSTCFIEAVDPTFVVFSAGHEYDHPSSGAASRYIAHGVGVGNMFRTDLGDDESADTDFEWDGGRIAGCSDGRGDDDVEIVLRANGTLGIAYRQPNSGC